MLNRISSAILLSATLNLFVPSVFAQTIEPRNELEQLGKIVPVISASPGCKNANEKEGQYLQRKASEYSYYLSLYEEIILNSAKAIDFWKAEIEKQTRIKVKGSDDYEGPAYKYALENLERAYTQREEKLLQIIKLVREFDESVNPAPKCLS